MGRYNKYHLPPGGFSTVMAASFRASAKPLGAQGAPGKEMGTRQLCQQDGVLLSSGAPGNISQVGKQMRLQRCCLGWPRASLAAMLT